MSDKKKSGSSPRIFNCNKKSIIIPVRTPFPQFPLFSTNKYANEKPVPSISASTAYSSNFKLFVLSEIKKVAI